MNVFLESLIPPLGPLTLVYLLGLVAMIHRRRRGVWLLAMLLVLWQAGTSGFPWKLREPLVMAFTPVDVTRPQSTHIAVLSAGSFTADDRVAVNGRANEEYMYRLLEGLRIHRAVTNSRMFVSMTIIGDPSNAGTDDMARQLAALLKVVPDCLIPVVGAQSTRDEARRLWPHVGTGAFYLVTSDYHLPRAMKLFRQQGMHPIPAPAGACGLGAGERPLQYSRFWPSAVNLRATDQSLHEYLGSVLADWMDDRPQDGLDSAAVP